MADAYTEKELDQKIEQILDAICKDERHNLVYSVLFSALKTYAVKDILTKYPTKNGCETALESLFIRLNNLFDSTSKAVRKEAKITEIQSFDPQKMIEMRIKIVVTHMLNNELETHKNTWRLLLETYLEEVTQLCSINLENLDSTEKQQRFIRQLRELFEDIAVILEKNAGLNTSTPKAWEALH